MSQLNDSYSPQSKIDLGSYRQTEEIPLIDTVRKYTHLGKTVCYEI